MSTHTEHAINPKAETVKYLMTLVALLILTAITVGASYINFGSGNIVIALSIATVKATIVGLIFMHLLHDKPVNAVIAVAGFVFLGIFLMFDFIDVDSRTNPQPTNLHAMPAAVAPVTPGAAGAAGAGAPAAATPAPAAATPAPAAATPAPAAATPVPPRKNN